MTVFAPAAPSAVRFALDERIADALLGPAELALRSRVRQVVAEEVQPRAADLDRTHAFAEDGYQALARAGLGGLLFPEELGGSAATTLGYAVAVEEIAAECGATSLIFMTQMHAAHPIMLAGTSEQKRRYVPPLCRGEAYGSLAITEPNAGSDAVSLRMTARRDGDHYILNGSKTFITTGDRADVIICFATVDRSAGRRGITAFILDGNLEGLSRGRPFDKMGMHGSSTAELFLDDVRIPVGSRLGDEGAGWTVTLSSVVKSRISAASQGVGLAAGALSYALSALRTSGPLDEDAAFAVAGLRTELLQARLLLYATAIASDREDGPTPGEIGMMKLACTDLGSRLAYELTGLLGVRGDLADSVVERYVRDSRVTRIYDGTNEVQRLLIARDTARRTGTA